MSNSNAKHILIGTAGHIDHGKTRLVGRLTGISTDRLPEEKSRGISIDLGFAHWESDGFMFGVVDVPGHERFVKNMVAGATGVNLALLVVAADDGVMPQTREHLEIMDLLGIRTGLVAITKIDLVEPDFVELVRAEIEELTAGTFLEGCPIVGVSAETNEGVEELKTLLTKVANDVVWPESHDLFRMPIDRVFSIAGHGTVVTGSVLSGDVEAGQTLDLHPKERAVRVRGVQTHGVQASESGARRRTAINLAGLKTEELLRGYELATPGYLRPTSRLLVELRCLSASPVVLKDRLEVNLHLGAAEASARIILRGTQLKPGERAYAELRLREPVVAAYGQTFIVRRISPAVTIGGGTVLDPFIPPGKRIREPRVAGASLHTASEIERLSYHLSQRDALDTSPLEAAWRVGVHPARYPDLIERLKADGALVPFGDPARKLSIHRDRLASLSESILRTIKQEIDRHQPRRSLPRNTLMTACRAITRPEVLDAAFEHLLKNKQLVLVGENVGLADAQVELTKNQRQTRDRILEAVNQGELTPPTTKELTTLLREPLEKLDVLLNLCVEEGILVKVSDLLFYTPAAIENARGLCEDLLQESGEATMSQLREAWGISRKFAVPLCEHFDALGITVRNEDVRVPGPNLGQSVLESSGGL